MKAKLLLVFAAVSLLALTVVPFASDGADGPSPSYYIAGYVADTERMPMAGAVVSVVDGNGAEFKGSTNADGFFSVGAASNSGLMISFTAFGYSTLTCPNTALRPGSEYLALNLSGAAYSSSTRTYTITGSVADMQCAIMIASDGVINGHVSTDAYSVKNATVTLTSVRDDGERINTVFIGSTDDRGYYSITCPTGRYVLTVSCQGLRPSDAIPVTVLSKTSLTVNVTMEKSELRKHLGWDTAHILMLVGVIVGVLVAVAAWFLSKQINMPRSLEIFDDSTEEDDELRHP